MERTIVSAVSILSGESLDQYFVRNGVIPRLSVVEEQNLLLTIKDGKAGASEAREHIIHAHQNFVTAVAERYKPVEMELNELIEAGNVGLAQSIDDYDCTRYERFYQYALLKIKWCIVQAIARKVTSLR